MNVKILEEANSYKIHRDLGKNLGTNKKQQKYSFTEILKRIRHELI